MAVVFGNTFRVCTQLEAGFSGKRQPAAVLGKQARGCGQSLLPGRELERDITVAEVSNRIYVTLPPLN